MGCVFISEKCIWNAEIPLQRRNKMPKTFSFDVVSSSRKSCKDAHFEHINKHHIIRTPCMAVHVYQKRATMAGIQHGHETQRLSGRHSLDAKPGKDLLESFRMSSVAFYFEGENALCTHTWLCARNRIQGFVHAFRALCTSCTRNDNSQYVVNSGSHFTKEFKIKTYDQNNDRILVNRMSSL